MGGFSSHGVDRPGRGIVPVGACTVQLVDVSNWINAALLLVAVVALVATVSQARTARLAQKESQAASLEAERHERAALAAAEASADSLARTSEATERLAEAIEDAQRVRTPWVVESLGGGHFRWRVRNMTGQRVSANLSFPDAPTGNVLIPETQSGAFREVGPGEAIGFTWDRRGPGSRTDARVSVTWYAPMGEMQISEGTAIFPA
jgi:hypothetical protein